MPAGTDADPRPPAPAERYPKHSIDDRTLKLGLRIIRLVAALKRTLISDVIAKQLLRSGTSIGANLAEAQSAFTRSDFRYLVNLSRKEACETRYWLTVLAESKLVRPERLHPLMQETEEIIRILSAIVKKTASK